VHLSLDVIGRGRGGREEQQQDLAGSDRIRDRFRIVVACRHVTGRDPAGDPVSLEIVPDPLGGRPIGRRVRDEDVFRHGQLILVLPDNAIDWPCRLIPSLETRQHSAW
jgi:hypothetical protein